MKATLDEGRRRNRLLAAMPSDAYKRLAPDLEFIRIESGSVLLPSGYPTRHVYFPTTALVSLLYVAADGGSAQIAVVGTDGVVGVSKFLGGESTIAVAVVQASGESFRIDADCVAAEFDRGGPAMRLLLRYTQALITQMAQTAVCNVRHSVEQRLCRCLLLNLDRLPGHEMAITQDLLANILGVRREGVSDAASRLQDDGVISYVRGHLTVRNRAGLESRACECYAVVRQECDRLLPYGASVRPPSEAEAATGASKPRA